MTSDQLYERTLADLRAKLPADISPEYLAAFVRRNEARLRASAFDRTVARMRERLPPGVSPEYLADYLRRHEARLRAQAEGSEGPARPPPAPPPPPPAETCKAQPADLPEPDALRARVLEHVRRDLTDEALNLYEIADSLDEADIDVSPAQLRTFILSDPYIRFNYATGDFFIVPPTPSGGPPPHWVVRWKEKGAEVLACQTCHASVPLDADPATILHRPLCVHGPLQFAAHKLPRIEALLGEINRRAAKLGVGGGLSLRVVREFLYSTHIGKHSADDPGWDCDPHTRPGHWSDLPYVEVVVEGSIPKIPGGWTVLGVLQHAPPEEGRSWTILRDAPGRTIPARYRTAGPDCEHCRLPRARKETVILAGEDGRVMQIGRSCLADYTGSTDAEQHIRAFLAWREHWARIVELAQDSAIDEQWALDPITRVDDIERFLAWVARCVRETGFVSAKAAETTSATPTGQCAARGAAEAKQATRSGKDAPLPTPEDLAQAREAAEWARQNLQPDTATSNFDHNLGVIVKRGYVDPSTTAIAPWIFERWRRARFPKEVAAGRNEWRPEEVGTRIGDLRLVVKTVRPEVALGTYGLSDLYVFADPEGRELKLFTTSQGGPKEGDVIEMTLEIRKKDEYKGRRQTIVKKVSRGWRILPPAGEDEATSTTPVAPTTPVPRVQDPTVSSSDVPTPPPAGPATPDLSRQIAANVDDYHEGRIDYETFSQRQRALWTSVNASDPEVQKAVLADIRERQPQPASPPAEPGTSGRSYDEARSALRALSLPPKLLGRYLTQAEVAVARGKSYEPVLARAREALEKWQREGRAEEPAATPPASSDATAEPSTPATSAPAPEGVVDLGLTELNDGRWISQEEARERHQRKNVALREKAVDPSGNYGVVPALHPVPKEAAGTALVLTLPEVPAVPPRAAHVEAKDLAAAVRLVQRVAAKHAPAWVLAAQGSVFLIVDGPEGMGPWFLARVGAEVLSAGVFATTTADLSGLEGLRGEVAIEPEGDRLTVRGAVGHTMNAAVTPRPLAAPSVTPQGTWSAKELSAGLRAVLYAASRDEARLNLASVLLDRRDEGTTFVATNGHQLAAFESSLAPLPRPVLLHHKVGDQVVNLLKASGPSELRVALRGPETRGVFGLAGDVGEVVWTLLVQELVVTFPPYMTLFRGLAGVVCSVDGGELAGAVASLIPLAGGARTVSSAWTIDGSELAIGYRDPDSGNSGAVRVPLACPSLTARLRLAIDAELVQRALTAWPFEGQVRLGLAPDDAMTPIQIEAEGPGWRARSLVMPMRIDPYDWFGAPADSASGRCVPGETTARPATEVIDPSVLRAGAGASLHADLRGSDLLLALEPLAKASKAYGLDTVLVVAEAGRVVLSCGDPELELRSVVPARVDAMGVAHAETQTLFGAARSFAEQPCLTLALVGDALHVRVANAVFSVGSRAGARGDAIDRLPRVLPASAHLSADLLRSALKGALAFTAWEDVHLLPIQDGVRVFSHERAGILAFDLLGTWTLPPFSIATSIAGGLVAALQSADEVAVAGEATALQIQGVGSPWLFVVRQAGLRRKPHFDLADPVLSAAATVRGVVQTSALRDILDPFRQAIAAERTRREAGFRALTGKKGVPVRERELLHVWMRVRLAGGRLELSIHGVDAPQTWSTEVHDVLGEATFGLDPERFFGLVDRRSAFKDADVLTLEVIRVSNAQVKAQSVLRVRAAGKDWRGTAALAFTNLTPLVPMDETLVSIALAELGELAGTRAPTRELLKELGLESLLRTSGPLDPRAAALRRALTAMKERAAAARRRS